MQINPIRLCLLAMCALSASAFGQARQPIVNFLGIKGPIIIQGQAYRLAWSSHPDASLYKHEYLAAGDQFPNYKSLLTVDFVVTPATVDQAVSTKIRQLEALKQTNSTVNYELMENNTTGEKIIDCLIGQTAADDRNSLVERNVFRYKAGGTASGQHGIILLAVSVRKYGKDIDPFLLQLKKEKPLLVNEVAKLSMPAIRIIR